MEQSFRDYRGQWGISSIISKKSVSVFSFLIFNEGEICGIRNTERFDCNMSVQVPITFTNLRLAIRVNRVP